MKKSTKSSRGDKTVYIYVVLLILVVAFFINRFISQNKINQFKNKIIPAAVKKLISNQKTEIAINNIKDANGVYEFELTMGSGNNAQKYISYITKDGKILFTSGIKLDITPQQQPSPASQKKLTCNDLNKTTTPTLTAFVVANCPYGLQMQRLFNKVLGEQSSFASNLNVKYLGAIESGKITSMHGDEEAKENLRQICIREEQKDLYWNYVSCYMKEGKNSDCLTSAGIDNSQLEACTADSNRGLKYAQADFDLANKLQISSSPTLLLNSTQLVSEFDFGGRVANAIKNIVCCASKDKPSYCSSDLSKEQVATSFSITVAAPTGTSNTTNSGCGTQ